MTKPMANGTNSKVKTYTCHVCGVEFQSNSIRPPQCCSDDCRDFKKYFSQVESKLIKIKPRMTSQSKKMISGDLFAVRNILRGK